MTLSWFFSKKVRQATDMLHHVRRLRNAQRDILTAQALQVLDKAITDMDTLIRSKPTENALSDQMDSLEETADKWLKHYPHPAWRENVEVFLVAIAVAMAIRTFFLQPFKIPTGSMQPTLYGVVVTNLLDKPNFEMPGSLARVYQACAMGLFYHEIKAEADGEILEVPKPAGFGVTVQPIIVRYNGESTPQTLKIWFSPELNTPTRNLCPELGLYAGRTFKKGESITKFVDFAGDHLFVDRVSYNFRHPTRGDIVVFKTAGIRGLNQDQFYIKRLIGLPGERVSIGEDRHAIINGKRLDASVRHFENVYGFDPRTPPHDSQYSGHIRDFKFKEVNEITVDPKHYMVFGDNTCSSWDSRGWGGVPQENVIGRYCFVYWPFTDRFGWGQE
jgi:signal peptidase I